MRSFVVQLASFLIVVTAAFSQKPGTAPSISKASPNDEQQIRQLESEMLKGEMNSDATIVERIYADDCVLLPSGSTKAKLVQGIHEAQGQAPPYIASAEGMRVYQLGDTAIAMFVKKYVVRNNPHQIDRQDITDVFVKSAGTWELKWSRSSRHQKTKSRVTP